MKLKQYLEELIQYLEDFPDAEDWEVIRYNYEEPNDDVAELIFKKVETGSFYTQIIEENRKNEMLKTFDLEEKTNYEKISKEIAMAACFGGCTGPSNPNAIIL